MDDQQIGWSLRAIRARKRWRQQDLAARAKVSRWVVMRIEQGRLASVPLGKVRAVAIYGERGVIDVLAWHPTTRILLVIELKTEVVDLNEMLGTLDRKRRLAWRIAEDRQWDPVAIATWVVVADSRTNRRVVADHATVLPAKFPTDGRGVARWL